jgi:lysophospholipase L1-like esterase
MFRLSQQVFRVLTLRALLGVALLLGAISTNVHCANAQNTGKPFYLKDGDRVVFYGDSITDSRMYTSFVETFVATRFPQMKIDYVHSGWGGDRVGGGGGGPIDVRLKRDVLAYNPTVVTIMLGMNDGSYRAFDQGIFDTYSKGFEHIIEVLKQASPQTRITMIQPSPYDDVTRDPSFEGGYNAVLVRYGDFVKELATRNKLDVADLNAPVVPALQKANAIDAATAKTVIPDRVHPGQGGHLVMAAALLKAWNAPSVVSSVEINAANPKVATVQTANTTVTDVQNNGVLSWTQLDKSLPMPLNQKDKTIALMLQASDVIQALNQQPLIVKGLTAAKYSLKIDGAEVGQFTKEELAAGVNLATLPTPMLAQAFAVQDLTAQHTNLHNQRWRAIQVPYASSKSEAVRKAASDLVAALDVEEAELVAQQRAKAQPVAHKFELAPLA